MGPSLFLLSFHLSSLPPLSCLPSVSLSPFLSSFLLPFLLSIKPSFVPLYTFVSIIISSGSFPESMVPCTYTHYLLDLHNSLKNEAVITPFHRQGN